MSQRSWVRGPICGVDNCRSRLYRSSDGMKICQYGHVMDGNIEINDDQDENFVSTKRLNIQVTGVGGDFGSSSVVGSQSTSIKTDNKLYGKEGRTLYYKCLQILLKKQTNSIIDTMLDPGIKNEFEFVIKAYWIKLLTYQMDIQSTIEENTNRNLKQARNRLPMALDIISIIYLAAVKLRYHPIYTSDIIAKIKSNQIPYAKCLHLIPKKLLDKLQSFYFQLLQPYKLPVSNEFYESIQTVGAIVCENSIDHYLEIPLNYYYPFIFRILSGTLILPNALDVFIIFNTLFEKLSPKLAILFPSKESKLTPKLTSFPDLKLVSLIILTVKLNFIYDISPVGFSSWLENLCKYELNNEHSFQTTRIIDLTIWSDSKIDKYCQWIYDNLVPKLTKLDSIEENPSTEELSAMDKRLFQIFDYSDLQDIPKTVKKRKLDPKQHLEPSNISIKDSIVNMGEGRFHKFKLKDVEKIEEKLFGMFSEILGVKTALLVDCYNLIELEVKKFITK